MRTYQWKHLAPLTQESEAESGDIPFNLTLIHHQVILIKCLATLCVHS